MTRSWKVLALAPLLAGCASVAPADTDGANAEEEVDVGYGTLPASRITGAVSRLDPDDVAEPGPDFADFLAGRVAGLHVQRLPGGEAQIRIRGATSLYGSNEPLFVVDGVPLAGGLPYLNPSDVKSVSVLKGAEGAIYGSRGANGVILVTTKRGRQ